MKTAYIVIIVVAVFTIIFHLAASASEHGIKDKRWTWCGEPKPEPDVPKPGPAL